MKKGFASMAIVYSFLLVFLLTLVSLLSLYTEKSRYSDSIVSEGKEEIGDYSTIVLPADIKISSITVNGSPVSSMPTTGNYYLDPTSSCTKGSLLEWNITTHKLYVKSFVISDSCAVKFNTTMLLKDAPVGSYVSYTGTNGCPTTEVTGTNAAQSANACVGVNANQNADTSGYTYGYCWGAGYNFITYGWRLAYTYDSDSNTVKEPYLVAAGSPQCIKTATNSSSTIISDLNTAALKYCNSNYVYNGSCTSTNVWAMKDVDFYRMIFDLYGSSMSLSSCDSLYSIKLCGHGKDIIDNGGYYRFASSFNSTNTYYYTGGWSSVANVNYTIALGLRPIIHLKPTIYITGGAGTMSNPYQIAY